VQGQWIQISLVWVMALIASAVSVTNLEGEQLYLAFSAIAASAIAIVSIEHLLTGRTHAVVRQQVYVVAGVLLILGIFTLISLAS